MEVGLGNGQGPDLSGACGLEHGGARVQRGTGRPHIIDQDDRSAFEPLPAPTGRKHWREVEGALDVPAPRSCIQRSLWCRGAHAPEHVSHRHTNVPRQLFSLVEASPCAPPRMEWYRYNHVSVLQQMATGLDHERRQWTRQPTPPIVFERVEDRSQRSFIVSGCPRGVDRAWGTATAGALIEDSADHAP